MDELIEGAKVAGQIIEASPSWIDRVCTSLDKWNLLPFGKFRKKNALDKAAIQQQLEIQKQEHQARIDLLNASIKANLDWREGAASLALEAAKRDIKQGVPAPEALKRHDPFLERSTAQLLVDTLEGQYARERIALYALDAASDTPTEQVKDGETSKTWTSRFWECAKGVRDEEAMQQWGKLLAEEVKNPESISLKTLDILRTINSRDAKIFFQLAPYVINNLFILEDAIKTLDIKYYDLITLEYVGLIIISNNIEIKNKNYTDYNRHFVLSYSYESTLGLSALGLTPSGKDILRICNIDKKDSLLGIKAYQNVLESKGIKSQISEI